MLGIIKNYYNGFEESINRMAGIRTTKKKELLELSVYSLFSFLSPFLLGHPQLLVGTVVNANIIMTALYARGKKILPVIILPSLGALSRGLLFGPLTKYLLYMIPFIWIGNLILLLSVKIFHLKMKLNFIASSIIGSALKSVFLFLSAHLLYSIGLIPKLFLVSMGIMQFVTASIATFGVAPIHVIRKKIER